MTQKMMKFVLNFRAVLYGVGFAALIVSATLHAFPYLPENTEETPSLDKEMFWPPDLVPHPHPPGSGPSGPGEPEMA